MCRKMQSISNLLTRNVFVLPLRTQVCSKLSNCVSKGLHSLASFMLLNSHNITFIVLLLVLWER